MLESAGVMDYVVAAYEVVPLLPEYSPTINAHQLKNALISREERGRVEKLIAEHGRLSVASLHAAVRRVGALRTPERAKMAGRFLADFMRYHRDLRRLETLHSALDSVHLVADDRVRQMSALNGMLYEFVLPEEHKPAEEKIVRHVVIKADIRDSTRLTRALSDRGLNPASHFSLNFYGPVNKLLAAYGASKVFLEGDAIILALLEREGESGFLVSRACMLAREIHDVVRAYNDHSRRADLPGLELGIGIAYQEASPMYLMDGDTRIMISDALNESDRLSSCSRIARRILPLGGPFGVYLFQLAAGQELNGLDDAPAHYNVGGIQLSAAAFARLQQEISLQEQDVPLPRLWENEPARLYRGLAPLSGGSFHPVVVREGRIPAIDARDLSFAGWTNLFYYEVCTNPALCEAQPPKSTGAAAGGGTPAG
jgi:class 3 adenylate cyclase